MGSRGGRSHAGGGGNASNPSLPESLQNFESKALADYRAIRQSTGLTAQQINYIHGQLQRVIDENDLAMAVKNSLIELILHSHFKNQMETGTSQGANAPGRRAQLSSEYFGHGNTDPWAKPEFFEKYGYLAPRDKVAADRNIPWYGDALVRFKRERVIDRTTFKTADTLNTWYGNNSARAAMVNNPTITGISNISRQTYDRIRNAESLIHDPSDWVDAVNNGEYFELQYHGHLTMDDVASITFHGSLPSQSVLDELKRRGIKIYKLNGGRVNEL